MQRQHVLFHKETQVLRFWPAERSSKYSLLFVLLWSPEENTLQIQAVVYLTLSWGQNNELKDAKKTVQLKFEGTGSGDTAMQSHHW